MKKKNVKKAQPVKDTNAKAAIAIKAAREARAAKPAAVAAPAAPVAAPAPVMSPEDHILEVIRRVGNDVMVLGVGASPIEAHPKYVEFSDFSQKITNLYLSNLNIAAKLLGFNIELKVFIKSEGVPSGSLPTTNG